MYNLLIVDDEEVVVTGLASDIDWSDLPLENIFTATSPPQALACVDANRIDLLIADIRMPGMDGIELTAKVRGRWPAVKSIFLSGYEEFAYARQAIDLGAFAYLTKPTAYEVIKDTVRRAVEEMDRECRRDALMREAEERMARATPVLAERVLSEIVARGTLDPELERASLDALGTGLIPSERCFLVMLRIDRQGGRDRRRMDLDEVVLCDAAARILFGARSPACFHAGDGRIVFIVQAGAGRELELLHASIEGLVERFQQTAEQSLGMVVSVFWGGIVGSMAALHPAYLGLLDLEMRGGSLAGGVALAELPSHGAPPRDDLRALEGDPSLVALLHANRRVEIVERIHRAFAGIESEGGARNGAAVQAWHAVARALAQASRESGVTFSEWAGSEAGFLYALDRSLEPATLGDRCVSMVERYLDNQASRRVSHTRSLVGQASAIARRMIGSQFTIADIARELEVHRNYLSTVFRATTGTALIDYLTDLKIERAKELLRRPGVKSYEVADQLGFQSPSHFTTVFRKRTGMTPAQYRIHRS